MLVQKCRRIAGNLITRQPPPRAPDAERRPSSMLTQPPHSRSPVVSHSHITTTYPSQTGQMPTDSPGRALPKAPVCLPTCLTKPREPAYRCLAWVKLAGTDESQERLDFLSPAAGWFPPRPIFPHPVC